MKDDFPFELDATPKPYIDTQKYDSIFTRTFNHTIESDELVWHRDEKDRYVEVLEGKNWEIQFEDQLPKKLNKTDYFFIPANTYHRIKRGTTNLVLKIEEKNGI